MKKKAEIHRMVMPDHLCPWGIKTKDLLKRHGYEVEDHHLTTMDESEQFKEKHDVDETPQIWIEGKHIGGYDELREHLDLGPDPKQGETYQPVLVIFAVALGMALTTTWTSLGALDPVRVIELFIAFTMCALGIQKLRDVQSYTNGFIQYDLLAQRYVPYATVYALIETVGGILMIAELITWIIAPIVLVATTIGAVSIIKAVFIDKRSLKCACVGGDSDVPLGFISLSENLGMMAMAIWMLLK
jgi:glutaredoxin/uncharacterized membrane protein YphA (DoxX/SURF4 family)